MTTRARATRPTNPRPAPEHMLHPAARLLWRPESTVQLELAGCGVVVAGPAVDAVRQLAVPDAAASRRSPTSGCEAALRALADAGFLWQRDNPASGSSGPGTPDDADPRLTPPSPRLAGELRALTVRHGERAGELLDARRHLSVVVRGDGRAGPLLAALLAAAGVGQVFVHDTRTTRLHQALPGGVRPDDEGRTFTAAASRAVLRAAPDTDVRAPLPDERTDLVVLACDEPVDPDHRDALHARGDAHLAVRLDADHGVVGPLVVPGLTSCLHCADLHRLDRDPAWSALAVQLARPTRSGAASPAALATTIAGVAATQALAYLDGEQPAVIEGTLEQHLPDWRIRRRSWPVHPDCGCCGEG